MVVASYTWLMYLYVSWSVTIASDNFRDIQIQQFEGSFLRLSCGNTNGTSADYPTRISIFADTPNNTLVSVGHKECPKVHGSATYKHIYLTQCVPNGENMFLDIVLTNYNPTENQEFGCYYSHLENGGHISHHVSFATVNSTGKSSSVASNEIDARIESMVARGENLEVIKDTPSSTVRDDTSIDDHGETGATWDTSLVLTFLTVVVCVVILLITVTMACLTIKRRRLYSDAKIKVQEYNKHEELEDCVYTGIHEALKPDNYDDCKDDNDANTSLAICNDTNIRFKSVNLSPEIVNGMEDYPYAQVNKLRNKDTGVHNTLKD